MEGTPLCPAGHLPLKGGDRCAAPARSIRQGAIRLPISPLEGEMPGRAEGGAPRGFIKTDR
ncbi:lytic murein transglycosylase [Agrobacterium salinitolerans]|uniref:Lytic murein transglycosylase n=1 Tax=Agrobacterium salinitolerans TaxID=1183413 RepID=A0ABY3BUN4_9HYPH|nr:lytic murein transglycosylase [Agrobacterium salinitolerans]